MHEMHEWTSGLSSVVVGNPVCALQVCMAKSWLSTSGRHWAGFRASASASARQGGFLAFPILTDAFGSEMAQDYESRWHNSIPSAILKVFPAPLVLSHAHTQS